MDSKEFLNELEKIKSGRADSSELETAMAYAGNALYEVRQILLSVFEGYGALKDQVSREMSKRQTANALLTAALRDNKRLREKIAAADAGGTDAS